MRVCVYVHFLVRCVRFPFKDPNEPFYEHVQRGVAVVDRLSLLPGDRLTSPNGHLRRIDSMGECGLPFLSSCVSLAVCLHKSVHPSTLLSSLTLWRSVPSWKLICTVKGEVGENY